MCARWTLALLLLLAFAGRAGAVTGASPLAIGDGSAALVCPSNQVIIGTGTGTSCSASLPSNIVNNSAMADDAVGIAELSATGTPSASTFLRGDNTWAVPADAAHPFVAGVGEAVNLSCNYDEDETADLRTMLEPGGDIAGKTLFLPDGCKLLIGTPGANDAVIDIAPGTTIQCEGRQAGFVFEGKHCVGGSTPGAYCDTAADCQGTATCECYDGSTSCSRFAPTDGTDYWFIRTTGTGGVTVKGCSVWVNQSSGDPLFTGGTGKQYLECTAGVDAGKACFRTCSAGSDLFAEGDELAVGWPCVSDTDCNIAGTGGTCQNASRCSGQVCAIPSYSDTSYSVAGPGDVNVFDATDAAGLTLEDVRIYDHAHGDYAVKGKGVTVLRSDLRAFDMGSVRWATSPVGAFYLEPTTHRDVRFGAVVTSGRIVGSTANGWHAGCVVNYESILTESTCLGHYEDLASSSYYGAAGILIYASNNRVTNNAVSGYVGIAFGTMGRPWTPDGMYERGFNAIVTDNYVEFGTGPKAILQSSGNHYKLNRHAWSSMRSVICVGDCRGKCAGGARAGRVCTDGPAVGVENPVWGCPDSACNPHDDFRSDTSANHVNFTNNFIHTNAGSGALPKHCEGGSNDGTVCTGAGDCTGGGSCVTPIAYFLNVAPGGYCNAWSYDDSDNDPDYRGKVCRADGDCDADPDHTNEKCLDRTVVRSNFNDNQFYDVRANIGVNLVNQGIGSAAGNGSSPSINQVTISGNNFANMTSGGIGIQFPTSRGTVAADGLDATGNTIGGSPTSAWTNFDWAWGDVSFSGGVPVSTLDPEPVKLRAGGTVAKGAAVVVDGSTTGGAEYQVVTAGTDAAENVIGFALNEAGAGESVRVAVLGKALCLAHDGDIRNGDNLTMSATTAGHVDGTTDADANVVAVALEDSSGAGDDFLCLVRPGAPNSATVAFPKFAFDTESADLGISSDQSCTSPDRYLRITHSTTSGKTVSITGTIEVDNGPTHTREYRAYGFRNGSSSTNCNTSATALVPASYGLTLSGNANGSLAFAFIDTGASTTSTNYHICVCGVANQNGVIIDGAATLVEF